MLKTKVPVHQPNTYCILGASSLFLQMRNGCFAGLKTVSRAVSLELGRPCPFNICLRSAWPWVLLCFKKRSSGVDLCPSLLGCSSPLSSGTTYLFFLHLANPGAAPHIFPKLLPQSWFPRPWGKADWLENLLFPPALEEPYHGLCSLERASSGPPAL